MWVWFQEGQQISWDESLSVFYLGGILCRVLSQDHFLDQTKPQMVA